MWIVTDSEMYHKHKIHVSTLMNGFILEGKAASLVVKEALRASHHLALIVIQGIRSSTTMSPITVELCDGAQAINCSWVYSRCSPLPSCLPPPLFFMYASVFHDYVFPDGFHVIPCLVIFAFLGAWLIHDSFLRTSNWLWWLCNCVKIRHPKFW